MSDADYPTPNADYPVPYADHPAPDAGRSTPERNASDATHNAPDRLQLNVAGIVQDSIVDGPGLRTAVFCQGCPRRCPDCHNPETWAFGQGTDMGMEDLLDIIQSNPLCRGVTFSGGEPFSQAEALAPLARRLKELGYETASYTGYTFEELYNGTDAQRDLLDALDVLIDGPFLLEEKSLELNFRGSRNQRVLNVPESLHAGRAVAETSPRWLGEY